MHVASFLAAFLAAASALLTSSPSPSTVNSIPLCCGALSLALSGKVSYASDAAYLQFKTSYFAAQEDELSPGCIVRPENTNDLATAIKILSYASYIASACKFAVRGGGHNPIAGWANIDHGVTIDMRSMSGIELSSDKRIASIGSGALWGDVYRKLDALDLSVIGGRVSRVGVGGLVIGGGLSFLSGREGFVCDNIHNYEIVLADGSIVNANAAERLDLWLALRGGGSNFGIVTRYDMETIQQGKIWGGSIFYDISTVPQQLQAFSDVNTGEATHGVYDEYAAVIQSIGYSNGSYAVLNNFQYTKPVTDPPVFQKITAIQPQLFNTLRTSNMTDFTDEQSSLSSNGQRELFMTTTFKNDLTFLNDVYVMWNTSLSTLLTVPGVAYSLVFQPLPSAITSKSASKGGNSMGLNPADGPLVLLLLVATWASSSDDAKVMAAAQALVDQVDMVAKAKGFSNRFKYPNYAAKSQDPFSGFGMANKHALQAASKKYDPRGFFQSALLGGFKVIP